MPGAAMDLFAAISPAAFGAPGPSASRASPGERPRASRRTARGARRPPSTAASSPPSRRGQARRSGVPKRPRSDSKTSGSSREERPEPTPHGEARGQPSRTGQNRAKPGPSPTRERIRAARAAAASARGRGGRPVAIMDVVLGAQERLDADDLADAVEQVRRAACGRPSAEDDVLADMLVPGRREARQAAFWRELAAAAQIDDSPRSIYRVSAERSTALWDGALAGDTAREPI